MRLITELNEHVEYFSEARESGDRDHYIHGIFLQADIPNRNGRIYPLPIMEKEVDRYIRENVEKHQIGRAHVWTPVT